MKTSDFAKHALGMGVALLITIILAAGFTTATATCYSTMLPHAGNDAPSATQTEGIVVTATRLRPNFNGNRLAKIGGHCQAGAC